MDLETSGREPSESRDLERREVEASTASERKSSNARHETTHLEARDAEPGKPSESEASKSRVLEPRHLEPNEVGDLDASKPSEGEWRELVTSKLEATNEPGHRDVSTARVCEAIELSARDTCELGDHEASALRGLVVRVPRDLEAHQPRGREVGIPSGCGVCTPREFEAR